MQNERKSGILLHPTSLPGRGGIGSLGHQAYLFADFLAAAGQTIWQVLPLNAAAYGNSPYSCYSSFAGNPLLIDLEEVVREGDLPEAGDATDFPEGRVDFHRVEEYRYPLLAARLRRFSPLRTGSGFRTSGDSATRPGGFTTTPCSWL